MFCSQDFCNEKNSISILDFWYVEVNLLLKRILLLTGPPGVGKTTVLIKTIDALKTKGVRVGGMISREAREGNARVGFEIVDFARGKNGWLANVNQNGGPKVGKYYVNLQNLENIGAQAIIDALECNVVAIDEVGPMELYSQKFKQAVALSLQSKKIMLAVVHAKAKDPVITLAKEREDAEIFVITLSNRNSLPQSLTNRAIATLNSLTDYSYELTLLILYFIDYFRSRSDQRIVLF